MTYFLIKTFAFLMVGVQIVMLAAFVYGCIRVAQDPSIIGHFFGDIVRGFRESM